MRQLEVLITSGGTICKIDDIRHIGNFSNGTTGAIIAEEFLKEGHRVHYVYARDAKRPFRRFLCINPDSDYDEQFEKKRLFYEEYRKHRGRLVESCFLTFKDYYNTLKRMLTSEPIDVVILAAAVSDYGIEKTNGKISSNDQELIIRLTRNPKVISLIKHWNPYVFQIGFKLLADVGLKELVDTGYEHGLSNNSDLTVANSINKADFTKSQTVIITPERDILYTIRPELAKKLYDGVCWRFGKNDKSKRSTR